MLARYAGATVAAYGDSPEVNPRHSVVAAVQKLKLPVGLLGGEPELLVPLRSASSDGDDVRGRCPPRKRHVGGRVRWKGFGVDRHIEATPLELPRSRQTNGAGAEYGHAARVVREGHVAAK